MHTPAPRSPFFLLAGLACALAVPPPLAWSQQPGGLAGDSVLSFRVRFGVTDRQERPWDGAVTVADGELLNVRDWRPRPENRIHPPAQWELATRRGLNFNWRPWETPPPAGPLEYYWTPGIIVDVRASAGTRLNFRTEQGSFSLSPRDVPVGRPGAMLDGAVLVDRVPPAEMLSSGEYQDDFA